MVTSCQAVPGPRAPAQRRGGPLLLRFCACRRLLAVLAFPGAPGRCPQRPQEAPRAPSGPEKTPEGQEMGKTQLAGVSARQNQPLVSMKYPTGSRLGLMMGLVMGRRSIVVKGLHELGSSVLRVWLGGSNCRPQPPTRPATSFRRARFQTGY